MDTLLLELDTAGAAPSGAATRDAAGAPAASGASNLASAFCDIAGARADHPAVATKAGDFSYGWLRRAADGVRRYLCGRPGHAAGARIALQLDRLLEHGERVLPGHAYIAPGDAHLVLARSGANYVAHLSDAPPVNRHRPSVDVLFRSAAQNAGKNVLGVILTGMGRDGAQGMLEMQQAGAYTFAQDEASCVVFGMPREAIATGGVSEIAPLSEMTRRVMARLNSMGERTQRV